MRGNLVCSILSICALAFVATGAEAQTFPQHSGSNDPTTEGWRYVSETSPNLPTTGPVTNDQGSGLDAWSLSFPTSNSGITEGVYLAETGGAQDAALTSGWDLTANLRFPIVPQNGFFFINLNLQGFHKASTGYALLFSPANNNGLTYQLEGSIIGGVPTFGGPPILLSDPTAYHLFEIQYHPGSGTADLFVDGAKTFSNVTGSYGDSVPFEWTIISNSNAGSSLGQVNLNSLQFTVVPEPATLTLLALGVVGLIAVRRLAVKRLAAVSG
jgi:PEP-CTERM motif